jgi:Fe-S-cluster containining protein
MATRLPILDPVRDGPLLPVTKTVAALDALWAEVASKPLYAPPHFWRYVKLRWQMNLSLIDPQKVKLAAPDGKINDCSSCNDLCCMGPKSTVSLRLRDIAMLKDVGREDLIRIQKPTFSAEHLATHPALRRTVASRTWETFPVLKRNAMGACAALTDGGKCGIYPYWPISCARFPYSLHLEDSEVFYSQRCDSFFIHPNAHTRAYKMAQVAVAGYNERIKDWVLLAYAKDKLQELGLIDYLSLA